jgi:tripartite-type tricarboxylate transporter receptor subunit TctC
MAKTKIVRVNYKGSGPSMMGLFVGEVQLMFAALGPVMPHVKSGKVKAIAITTPKRSPLAPDLPPVSDALPGYASEAAIGFFAPKKTPVPIIRTLNTSIQHALKGLDPQIVFNAGVEVVGGSPDDFSKFIKADMSKMGEVIKSGSFSN